MSGAPRKKVSPPKGTSVRIGVSPRRTGPPPRIASPPESASLYGVRIVLIHWNEAEAQQKAAPLRKAGHEVACLFDGKDPALRRLASNPPDLFVIDLNRIPSQGRDIGLWLRNQKTTRHVPILFVEGDPEKTARARALLPDAFYTPESRLRGSVRTAIRKKPGKAGSTSVGPVRPGLMDGYSGAPLPKKLGVPRAETVLLLNAPKGFEKMLGPLPEGTVLGTQARGRGDLVVLFCRGQADLQRRFPAAVRALADRGKLWLAWPKKSSGVDTDLTQNHVRAFGLERGLVDFKICALDSTWSGLCFVRRGERRTSGTR